MVRNHTVSKVYSIIFFFLRFIQFSSIYLYNSNITSSSSTIFSTSFIYLSPYSTSNSFISTFSLSISSSLYISFISSKTPILSYFFNTTNTFSLRLYPSARSTRCLLLLVPPGVARRGGLLRYVLTISIGALVNSSSTGKEQSHRAAAAAGATSSKHCPLTCSTSVRPTARISAQCSLRFQCPSSVSCQCPVLPTTVRRTAARAMLCWASVHAYRLLHTAALAMSACREPLSPIVCQVFLHRLLFITSSIYSKIDIDSLRELSRPCPYGIA